MDPYRDTEKTPDCDKQFSFVERLDMAIHRQRYTAAAGAVALLYLVSGLYLPLLMSITVGIAGISTLLIFGLSLAHEEEITNTPRAHAFLVALAVIAACALDFGLWEVFRAIGLN